MMRDIALFLRLLSEHVYHLRDAGDFHAWLLECSELAGQCSTVQEFFESVV